MVKLKYNKQRKKWEELPKGSPEGIYIDGKLLEKLQNIKKIQAKDWDCIFQVDGMERAGKSTFATTLGTYLYPQISIKNYATDLNDAIKKVDILPDKSLLIIDEGSLSFSSKDVMNRQQKKFIKILNVCGQKGLIVIVVSPSFFNLSKYISVERSRFLIHTYVDDKMNRGRFCYFGSKQLRMLYELGKKNYNSYVRPRASFIGRFMDYQSPFHKEYLKLKQQSLRDALNDKPTELTQIQSKDFVMTCLKRVPNLKKKIPNTQLARLFGVSDMTIGNYYKEIQVNHKNQEAKI